ncbi:MAG: ATP-grasp domain-containing protein [Chloroflexota bacterium]
MPVLILGPKYSQDSKSLAAEAEASDWAVWRFEVPYIPDWVFDHEPVLYCGDIYAEFITQELEITLATPNDDALAGLSPEHLRRKVIFTKYQNFERPTERKFIKPADQKFFKAGIYEPDDEIPGLDKRKPEDPILISDVVEFVDEFRLFIVDGQVETGSQYIAEKQLLEDAATDYLAAEIKSFGHAIAQVYQALLPRTYVVDIGRLVTGELAVIEFNQIWASGLYGASPKAVLNCLQYSVNK